MQALDPIEYELFLAEKAEAIEASKNSLTAFIRLMWHIIEPGTPFVSNWHIDAVSEHLEAVTRGEIRRLLINMPPRHMKSIQVSAMWPAWVWSFKPELRWFFASYSHTFAIRDAMKMRDIVKHQDYKDYYAIKWGFKPDQDTQTKFENEKRGYRFTTSVTGGGTGEGGDIIVADDPHNALEADSQVARETVIRWWTQTMSTRGNDAKTTRRVVVMQRLHEKDLCGHLLSEGGYEQLILPAEFEKPSKVTSLGWVDPRKEKGELLWPEKFPVVEIEQIKKDLGTRGANSQLQQNPLPSEGGLFKRHWWQFFDEPPLRKDLIFVAQFWDTAQKVGISNDESACRTVGQHKDGQFYHLDLWHNKVEAPELEVTCVALYNKWKPDVVVIEDKSSGSSLIQYLRRKHRQIPVVAYDPRARDKEVRASAATPSVEAGNHYLPRNAPWLEDHLQQHERFPLSEYKDLVDTTSMCVEFFQARGNSQPRIRML